MDEESGSREAVPAAEAAYEIRVDGAATHSWPEWFPGVRLGRGRNPDRSACTILLVPARDASLLHGVLAQIGGLNLRLLSVKRIERRKP